MGGNRYYSIFLIIIINLIGFVFLLPKSDSVLFVKQFYFMLMLLVVAGIGLYALARCIDLAYMLFAVLFAVILLDEFYIYFSYPQAAWLFYSMVAVGILGFLISIGNLRPICRMPGSGMPGKKPKKTLPQPIIVDAIPAAKEAKPKVAAKKKAAKRPAAKKKATKAVVKKSASKRSSKRSGKPAKKSSKKSTAKKRK